MNTTIQKIVLALLSSVLIYEIASAQTCPNNYVNQWEWPTHSNWFFGEGTYLNFPGGTGNPTFFYKTFSRAAASTNQPYEGTATVSDNSGNLLAYTNGRSLWSGNGTLISNGLLAGNEDGSVNARSSAVQGVTSVRHPLNPNMVYIFTTDDALNDATTLGFNYSVLDLTTNTMSVPVRLKDDVGNNYRTTEQVNATFHSNGFDVWIIVRQSGRTTASNYRNFYSYLLTCSGLNTTPVKSSQVAPEYGHRWNYGASALSTDAWDNATNPYDRGALKVSWDGKKVATVNHVSGYQDKDEAIMIFDFDNSTGKLSNPKAVSAVEGQWSWVAGTDYSSMYSCEWAPDSKGLFVTSVASAPSQGIFWLDASLPTASAINASIKLVSNNFTDNCDIKLGGDAKLYQPVFNQNKIRTYSFSSLANLNSGTSPTVADLSFSNTFDNSATAMRGLSNMFNPPVDEPAINSPGALCSTGSPVNLSTDWICSGADAELSSHEYVGTGITDATLGTFNPALAGVGNHQIIFRVIGVCSALDDTLTISVSNCGVVCKDTTLSNSINPICVNGSVNLDNYKVTAETGTWSIVSAPSGVSPATLSGSTFSATNADSGTYRIRFTISGAPLVNCPDSAERNIIVNALPAVSVNNASICSGGSPATFTATSPTAVSYLWSGNGTGTAATTSGSTAGNYTVEVTDVNSCKATASGSLTLNALPVVSVNSQTICDGASATFTATAPTAISYLWSGNGTGTAATTSGSTAGNYTVEVTDVNSCKATANGTLTLNALPTVSVNSDTICDGDAAVVFTATAPTAVSYVWSNNGNGTSSTTSGNTEGTYTVEVTDINSCKSSASGTLTVNDKPTINLVPTAEFCAGSNTTVDAGISGMNYWWTPGNLNSQSISVNTAGVYEVVVSDPLTGCKDSALITVSENTLPTVVLADQNICAGAAATLSPANPNFSWTYKWSNNSSDTLLSVSSPGNYWLEITDSKGCKARDTATVTESVKPSISANKSVLCLSPGNTVILTGSPSSGVISYSWTGQANNNPLTVNAGGTYTYVVTDNLGCIDSASYTVLEESLPAVTLNDVNICVGSSSTLNASTGATGENYLWNTGETTSTIQVSSAGIYWVTVTSANSCSKRDTATINSNANPIVSLPADTSFCSTRGDVLPILASVNGITGGTWEWSNGEIQESFHLSIAPITLWAKYTDSNGCSDMDTIVIAEHCVVPPIILPNLGKTFNPVNDPNPNDILESRFEVYDRWGLKMYQSDLRLPIWDGTYNGNQATSGVYFYIWEYTDVTKTKHQVNGYFHLISEGK